MRSSAWRAAEFVALACLIVAAASVYWIWPALPFQDLPGHAGLIGLRTRIPQSAFDQSYFVHVPRLGPYTVFRALGSCFARVGGPLFAVRLLATLPVFALPAAVLCARKLLFARSSPGQGFLAVLLSFGFMTISGFASYNLAIAVFILATAVHVALLTSAPGARRWRLALAVAGLSVVLYLCHGFAFGLGGLAVVGASLVGGKSKLLERAKYLLLWLPGALVAGYASYVERFTALPPEAIQPRVPTVPYYDGVLGKLSLLATPTLMTRTGVDVGLGVLLWLSLVAAIFRARRTASEVTRKMLAMTAVLGAAFLVLPHGIGWFGFVDGRVAPLLLLVPIVGLDDAAWPKFVLRLLAPVLALAMVVLVHVAAFTFQAEARGAPEVLANVPAQARLLSLMVSADSKIFTASPFTHYDKLVLADRDCIPSAMWFHQGSAIYPTAKNPVLGLPASYHEADIGHVDWALFRLADWDYVFLRQLPEQDEPRPPDSLSLVAHAGSFWLYAVRHPPRP